MTTDDLRRLYEYSYWANAKLLGAMSALTPEEFARSVAGSYESIRNTLVHSVSAEWGWLDRCGGAARGPKLTPDDYPTLATVIERGKVVEAHMRRFLAALTEPDLSRVVEF